MGNDMMYFDYVQCDIAVKKYVAFLSSLAIFPSFFL